MAEDAEPAWENVYHLEQYLMGTVRQRFHAEGHLELFDFFCIVAWKANRARTKVAARLRQRSSSLAEAVEALTRALSTASSNETRFRVLIADWGLRLPMASAILTILYPDDFTVYDRRVCDELNSFQHLGDRTSVDALWSGYSEYMNAVRAAAPAHLCLRDKDRWLWGRSFGRSLRTVWEGD